MKHLADPAETGDLLLYWASELGSGGLVELKQGVDWLAAKAFPELEDGASGRWVRDAVALGYLDVDWRARRWCAAPPAAVTLPDGTGLAMLTGSRARQAELARLAEAPDFGLSVVRIGNPARSADIPPPTSVFVQYERTDDLADWADAARVPLVGCFAESLVSQLPVLPLGEPAAAPATDTKLERYGMEAQAYERVARANQDGLYRFRRADSRQVCQLLRSGEWREVQHEWGVFHELQRTRYEDDVMRWAPEKARGRSSYGTLYTSWGYPLPDIHRRIAALCSGLAPQVKPRGRTLAYQNVPQEIAQRIAGSLGQSLGGFDE